jgi:hypothetical protein
MVGECCAELATLIVDTRHNDARRTVALLADDGQMLRRTHLRYAGYNRAMSRRIGLGT